MVETLSYTYTSRSEMNELLSSVGVDFRLDDLSDPSSEDAVVLNIVSEATDMVNFYCGRIYDEVDLNDSMLARRWATWIGVYLLSQRRGNPSLFEDRYQEVLAMMEKVTEGTFIIPRLPTKADFTPAMSNLHVDDRFRVHKLRVHPTISTGGTSSRQDLSPRFPFEWL